MPRLGVNPYAPPAYNGIDQSSVPPGYRDVSFDYVYNPAQLTANQIRQDQLSVDNDADFCWRAIVVNNNTGAFAARFSDSDWYWLSSARISNTNLQGDPASPYPWFPEVIIPAGGRIGIEVQDLSGNPNTIQMLFRGCKRYAI